MKEFAMTSTLTPCTGPRTPLWVWVISSSLVTSTTVTFIKHLKVIISNVVSKTGRPIGTRISGQDLMTYLNRDSANALRDARRLYPGVFDSLPSEVQLIIADMMFNLGYSRLSRFRKMKAAVLKRDWATAADEMVDSAWYGQVGTRSRDLVRRMRSVR